MQSSAARQVAHFRSRKVEKEEILNLLELRNHIEALARIYFRKRSDIGQRVIAGAEIDGRLTVEEIVEMVVVD
jgi:hypothetical protein